MNQITAAIWAGGQDGLGTDQRIEDERDGRSDPSVTLTPSGAPALSAICTRAVVAHIAQALGRTQ